MIHTARIRPNVIAHDITAASNATARQIFSRGDGEDYATFLIIGPAADATNASARFGALKFQEADTTDATAFSDITDGPFTGTTNSTAATSEFLLAAYNDTDSPWVGKFNFDLRPRKKHIGIVYQAKDATDFASGLSMVALAGRRDVDSGSDDVTLEVNG